MSQDNETKSRFDIETPLDNVCKFSDTIEHDDDMLAATRFIYETSPEKLGTEITYAAFGCHLVTGGSAVLVGEDGEHEIGVGDMFFSFPMIPFSFKNIDGLKYLYVNFVGSGAEQTLISFNINRGKTVQHELSDLIDIWFFALARCTTKNLPILGKGVLYYSLGMLPIDADCAPQKREEDIAEIVRKSVDISYSNEDLSIEYYAKKYKYNSKYLSRKFAAAYNVPFSEYLKSCRINHACTMLQDSEITVAEVASRVGYHDPLYFSKVFRSVMGMSPTEYRTLNK